MNMERTRKQKNVDLETLSREVHEPWSDLEWIKSENEYYEIHISQDSVQPVKRKRGEPTNLDSDEEEDLVEWLRSNKVLYTENQRNLKNAKKRQKLWDDKAKEMGHDANTLQTWYRGLRTRFCRILKKSEDDTRALTERDTWIINSFGFLNGHIRRTGNRQGQKESIATAQPGTSGDSFMADDPGEMEDEEDAAAANSIHRSRSVTPENQEPMLAARETFKEKDVEVLEKLEKMAEQLMTLQTRLKGLLDAADQATSSKTSWAKWMATMVPAIHDQLWKQFLRQSFDTIMWYVQESDRLQQQEQQPCQQFQGPHDQQASQQPPPQYQPVQTPSQFQPQQQQQQQQQPFLQSFQQPAPQYQAVQTPLQFQTPQLQQQQQQAPVPFQQCHQQPLGSGTTADSSDGGGGVNWNTPGSSQPQGLVAKIHALEAHVVQLKNLLSKAQGAEKRNKKRYKERPFDFSKYNTRHVALKVCYFGWDYQGFAAQEDTCETIEAAVFDALQRTKLIESRDTSAYHRCGRTDKGVSALGQVISLDLRTNLLAGKGVIVRENGTAHERAGDKETEIAYVHILNKVLPREIRILAWCPVEPDFSARFSCTQRTYKYFFPRGSLNLQLMNEAASRLIGSHDFRNLCKMDVANGVTNFIRRIDSSDVKVIISCDRECYQMCELTVVGKAFLWHQIRCIVSILFHIGQGKEEPSVIDRLLDVENLPGKPQYTFASELPLNLFDCVFEDVDWIYEHEDHMATLKHLQEIWTEHMIKSTMIKQVLGHLETVPTTQQKAGDSVPEDSSEADVFSDTLIPGNKPRVYQPLLERPRCEPLEERIQHFSKKRKLTRSYLESEEMETEKTTEDATSEDPSSDGSENGKTSASGIPPD